ncbi:hypothetical protein DK37_13235 [Halomonas sp. SUBG004]|nr:hypothetical protein DK37_13235 [Halomonas sp. SUBG004]
MQQGRDVRSVPLPTIVRGFFKCFRVVCSFIGNRLRFLMFSTRLLYWVLDSRSKLFFFFNYFFQSINLALLDCFTTLVILAPSYIAPSCIAMLEKIIIKNEGWMIIKIFSHFADIA